MGTLTGEVGVVRTSEAKSEALSLSISLSRRIEWKGLLWGMGVLGVMGWGGVGVLFL